METTTDEDFWGDAPARAVIAANKAARKARRVEQTKDELQKIQRRVDQMIQAFEQSNLVQVGQAEQRKGMEVVEDVDHLESILGDRILKKKYQQQLTVFIVGYQETCGQRNYLLSQLQEFFSFYANLAEEDAAMPTEEQHPEMDDVADKVKAALHSSERAMNRLADLNKQLVSYLHKVRPTTGNPKSKKITDDKGRKKLEKAMEQARDDIMRLTNSLLQAQAEVESKDKMLKEVLKQNEAKGLECQHFQAQLEHTKKNLERFQEDYLMQRTLLEAEVRRQVASVTQLEEQLRAKEEEQIRAKEYLRREMASQWSDRELSSIEASERDMDMDKELEAPNELERLDSPDTVKSPTISRSPSPLLPLPTLAATITDLPDIELPEEAVMDQERHVESSLAKRPEEQDNIRCADGPPLPTQLGQTPSDTQPQEQDTGSMRSPDIAQDPKAIHPATEQRSDTAASEQKTPPSGNPPADINNELAAELAEANKEHQESTARLKTDFQMLAAHWEEERQGLLQQIQQAAKDQAVSERKAAYALNELQRLSEQLKMPPTALSTRSGSSSSYSSKRASTPPGQSNGQPSRTGSPMSSYPRPDSGRTLGDSSGAAEAAFDEGIRRLHDGIRALIESVKKGLLAQGLHSLAQLLDDGWLPEKDGVLVAPSEERKAELAKSLELLQNATEVFHSLLESISYHSGAPLSQEGVTSDGPAGEDLYMKDENQESLVASERPSTAGSSGCRSIVITPPRDPRQERDPTYAVQISSPVSDIQAGVLFTHLDEAHNRRVLHRAVSSGRVALDLYQDAIMAMDSYGQLRSERLASLLSGYIRKVSLKGAIQRIKREIHSRPESGQALRRLQRLEQQVVHRWRAVRCHSSQRRLQLSSSLNETLRNVEEQSGIFLIKPIISWPGTSTSLKSTARINAYLKAVPKNLRVSQHRTAGQQEAPHLPSSAKISCGIRLNGMSLPTNLTTRGVTHTVWNGRPSEPQDQASEEAEHVIPRAMVITPKILEMDVNSYLFDEYRVSVISQLPDSSSGSIFRPPGTAVLRNFLPVRRATAVSINYSEKR